MDVVAAGADLVGAVTAPHVGDLARIAGANLAVGPASTMDIAYISALSALAGSVVGSATSGLTTWLSQRFQAKAEGFAHETLRRQNLYRDFITAASKAYAEALLVNEPKIDELIGLFAMISRMRALSSPRIIACAEEVLSKTTSTYFQPNRTIPELHELVRNGVSIDPLKDFAEAVREERPSFSTI